MPKVSVIMPSFNYSQYINRAIESVLSQSMGDLELVITDDCSTDASSEMVEFWKTADRRVIAAFHTKNCGLSASRNTALTACSGEFVAFCDADDIWKVDKLKIQLECFSAQPDTGVVHSDALIVDENGCETGKRISEHLHQKGQAASGYVFDDLCRRNFVCVPTVIVRARAIKDVGGFDETLRSLEDWVCWTKIARNYSFAYIADALAYYRVHSASLSRNSKNMATNRIKAIHVLLRDLADISPRSRATMLYSLGMSHLQLNDPKNAAQAFLGSVLSRPTCARSWARWCQSLLRSTGQAATGY